MFQRILAGCASQLLTVTTYAETLTFRVFDENMLPLSMTVISVPGASKPAAHQDRIMDRVNVAFEPHVLVINQGDSVSFSNSDNMRQHVYSFSKPKPFEIKLYAERPEARVDFNTPGIVVLGCNIHDTMIGYIYVSSTPQVTITDNDGVAQLQLDDAPSVLSVWHERHSLIESTQMELTGDAFKSAKKSSNHYDIILPAAVAAKKPMQDHSQHGFGNSMRR
jgi:plastocyanin